MQAIAFIVNPVSGRRNKDAITDKILSVFSENEVCHTAVHLTAGPGDAFSAANAFIERGFTTLVAVGGDGTVNEVGRAVAGSDKNLRLGIVPAGSGNGLARHLKLPMRPSEALAVIRRGRVLVMDTAYINDNPFFCTAGVGFDAAVGYRFNTSAKRGFIPYACITLREYVHYRPTQYLLTIDGRELEREAFLITFANASQWGYDFYIAPGASVTDGLIDVVVWKRAPLLHLPGMAVKLCLKNIRKDLYVETFRCRDLRVERKAPGFVHYDGESRVLPRILRVGVKPQALSVFVP